MSFGSHSARSFTRSLLLALSLVALSPHAAQAAVLTLNNGDRISGSVVQMDDDTLSFKSAVFGEVKIPWTEVQTLVADEDVRVQLRDGATIAGKLALHEDGTIRLGDKTSTPGGGVTLRREEVAALNPPVADRRTRYTARFDLGGSSNRGNTREDNLNLIGELGARTAGNRYTIGFELNEARTAGTTTASNQRLRAQYDAFLNERDFLFVSAKAERDELADLDLRSTLGAGYGRQFIDSDHLKLSGQIGLSYVRENYGLAPSQSFPGVSLGLKYDHEFFNKRLVYFQYHDIDTSLRNARDTLLRTRLGLRVPFGNGINVSTQLNIDYKHRPTPGNRKTDSALIFSVGYGF